MALFGTAGIRGPTEDEVTPELAQRVGRAVGRDAETVVLGRDGRVTSEGLAAAVEAGLLSGGADVRRLGQVPTAVVGFASRDRHGVMLTASHNPPADNGIKCFVDGQEYDRDHERRVADRVGAANPPVEWSSWGSARRTGKGSAYRRALAAYAAGHGDNPENVAVAVDCGNGMGSLATPQILRDLGADVTALNATVDGHFPGRDSKPTPESIRTLREFVADSDVDFGVAHDGDADRVVVVGRDGAVVHEDTVVAVLGEYFVRAASVADPVVVTTPNASARIDERVQAAGGRVERVRLGALHEGVARVRDAGDEATRVVFAAEPWKHIHPDFGGWIDGIATAALLARLVAVDGLAALTEPVAERPYRKRSVACPERAKAGAMERLEAALPETFPEATVSTDYGIRLTFSDGGWLLVRPSGTEPYLRLYAERDAVDDLAAEAASVLERAIAAASDEPAGA